MKKVAVVVTDLVEDVEFVDPVKAIRDAGHVVTVIGFERTTVTGPAFYNQVSHYR